ncbi:MAG: 4-hydroxy-tetrahydrodipicolinate synthase [Lachnospiraceae bacterium]|nr:4-hydroxy-tetrahydrodipicolinate synthase [Lachnospiraceae bacterium]
MSIFKGAGVAITTPFLANGEVDYDTFRDQIEYQIQNGTDAIIVCGTTGEASCLSHEEHLDCIKFCVEVVNKRIPVIAGTGSNCTETAIYLSTEAEKYGVDGLLVVTPYYNKATQKGLIEHYTMVAESVKLPIIMYNVPSRTGCNILPETAAKLCKNVPNIVGIKEASGDISQVAKVALLCGDDIDIYSGNDDQIIPILALGGKGVISVLSNIAPKQTHDICQAFFDGDTAKAAKLQIEAIPLVGALFCEVNPIPVKKAIELQGRDTGVVRRPLTEMEPQNAERLKKEMQAYNVL